MNNLLLKLTRLNENQLNSLGFNAKNNKVYITMQDVDDLKLTYANLSYNRGFQITLYYENSSGYKFVITNPKLLLNNLDFIKLLDQILTKMYGKDFRYIYFEELHEKTVQTCHEDIKLIEESISKEDLFELFQIYEYSCSFKTAKDYLLAFEYKKDKMLEEIEDKINEYYNLYMKN